MSSFDELTGDLPDEEWDAAWAAYTAGAESAELGSTRRGFVSLPIGLVEIRGDDVGLERALPPASDNEAPADLLVEVEKADGFNWSVTDLHSGKRVHGSCGTLAEVIEAVVVTSIGADEENLYLNMTLIDNGRVGVGVVAPDSLLDATSHALSGVVEGATTGALIDPRWRILSDSVVVLAPQTRTVTTLALMRSTASDEWAPRLRVEVSTLDHILFLRADGTPDANQQNPDTGLLSRALIGAAVPPAPGVVESSGEPDPAHIAQARLERSKATTAEAATGAVSRSVTVDELARTVVGLGDYRSEDSTAANSLVVGTPEMVESRPPQSLRTVRRPPASLQRVLEDIAEAVAPTRSGSAVLMGPMLDALDGRWIEPDGGRAAASSTPGPDTSRPDVDGPDTAEPNLVEFLVDLFDRHAFESALRAAGLIPLRTSVTSAALRSGAHTDFTVQPRDAPNLSESSGGSGGPGEFPSGDMITVRVTSTVGTGLFAQLVDLDDFYRMAVPVRVGSRWLLGIHPVHRYILACLRLYHDPKDRHARISALLNAPQSAAAARRLLRLVERCGVASPVRMVTRTLWGSIPDPARSMLEELGV